MIKIVEKFVKGMKLGQIESSSRAEMSQKSYESTGQSSDLVYYQKAMERELGGSQIQLSTKRSVLSNRI
jgi:hypothetical protein